MAFSLVAIWSGFGPLVLWDEVTPQVATTVAFCAIGAQLILVGVTLFLPQGSNMRYFMLCRLLGRNVDPARASLDKHLEQESGEKDDRD